MVVPKLKFYRGTIYREAIPKKWLGSSCKVLPLAKGVYLLDITFGKKTYSFVRSS